MIQIHLTTTYILLVFFQRLPLVTDKSEQLFIGHLWMFLLVRGADIILEEDVGRGGTLGCIGVLEFPFALLL